LETFAQHPNHKELRNKWKKLGNVFKRLTNPTYNNKKEDNSKIIEMNKILTCARPHITIRSHDLHVGDIRGAMGEIASYHKRD
jgi:hypothetical protein